MWIIERLQNSQFFINLIHLHEILLEILIFPWMYLIGIFQGSLNVVCPIVHMWRTCHCLSFIPHVRTTHFYNSFIKEFSLSSLRGSWHFAHTYYECGIHRNGSYTCEHMQLLSHLFKRDAPLSFFFTHITLMLLYWAILLHHSLSLFSRHLPSFIILTRGFLYFPLSNPLSPLFIYFAIYSWNLVISW